MTKIEAERLIVAEMRKRLPIIPYRESDGGLIQYQRLKKERPELFEFKSAHVEQWVLISGWLKKHGLVR